MAVCRTRIAQEKGCQSNKPTSYHASLGFTAIIFPQGPVTFSGTGFDTHISGREARIAVRES
ncbi:unnamed protein product, partial [Nesidiocoris tenuis]